MIGDLNQGQATSKFGKLLLGAIMKSNGEEK